MAYLRHWKPGSGANGEGASSPEAGGSSGSSVRDDTGAKALSRVLEDFRPALCARRVWGTRPPSIESISAVRRFMPGGLLAGLAGGQSDRRYRTGRGMRDSDGRSWPRRPSIHPKTDRTKILQPGRPVNIWPSEGVMRNG